MKPKICKNCIRFEWTSSYCSVNDQYLEDDDTCDKFQSSWSEVEITESDVGKFGDIFK